MGYLSNRTINCLNMHAALLGLLEQAFGTFMPIYFYTRGFPLPEVFGLLALIIAARLPLRLFSFPIVHTVGLKTALMIGTTGYCLSFPLLSMVKTYDHWLWIYVGVFGLFNALYWHCFHTFYSMAGEQEHRGKHLSVALSLSMAIGALAPLLSAMFIARTGFEKFFLFPIPLLLMMLYVLSRCENIPAARTSWSEGKKLMFNLGARIHIAEASAYFPLNIAWLFVVYFYLEKMVALGGILTFGILIQILYQLWVGKMIDRQRGHFVAHAAGSMRAIQVLIKTFMPLSLPRVIGIEAWSGAADVHHRLAQPTMMYNAGKHSGDPFWYWLFAESAFDIGSVIGAGSVALLLLQGVPLQRTVLLAFPGVLIVWWLTNRYFHNIQSAKN